MNVQVVTRPSLAQVQTLWDAMQADTEGMQYYRTDASPTTFDEFTLALGKAMVLLLGTVDGVVAGGLFLRDEKALPLTQAPHYCTVDLYVLPAYRGSVGFKLCQALRRFILETMGFQVFYAVVRPDHKACQHLLGALGFYRCGVVPRFLAVQGELVDVILYASTNPVCIKGDK